MRGNKGRFTNGITYEETFGVEKAEEIKSDRRQRWQGNKINLGRKQSPEEIQKRNEGRLRRIALHGYTEAELKRNEELAKVNIGRKHNPERRKIESLAHIGVKVRLTPEGKERKRQSLLGNQFAKNRTAPCSEETKQKIGRANATNMKVKWQEDSYVAMQMKARNCSPNKPEQKLTALIDSNQLPFSYVGDGQFILGGKCPDFLGTGGRKQLIELFGTYWHGILDIGYRVEYFRQYGYSTLIIWEDELNDETRVLQKIRRFSIG